jgi:hypothetical protein
MGPIAICGIEPQLYPLRPQRGPFSAPIEVGALLKPGIIVGKCNRVDTQGRIQEAGGAGQAAGKR